METFILDIAGISEYITHLSWLPLLIWTLLSGLIWAVLHSFSSVHPQYQYHGRLALLFALPAGFIALAVIQSAEHLFFTSSTSSGLSFITVSAPFELTVTSTSNNALSVMEIIYAVSFILLSAGMVLFIIRNVRQWCQLMKLKSSCDFTSIKETSGLDTATLNLIQKTKNQVQIAFPDEEFIPVTFGLRKPLIIVPASVKQDSENLNLVLQHELTHVIQKDFLSNIVLSLTQIVFWFHPMVHVLKRELIDYREIRCDSLVLSNETVSRKKYASLLLELLPMPNVNQEFSVNMAQESSNLKKRIQMITQQTFNHPIPKRASIAIFAFIILSTTVAMSCTDMQTQGDETSNAMLQTETQSEEGNMKTAEQMPELIGGLEELSKKIQYPEEARQAGIEGQVFVQFIVNQKGNVEDAKVIRGIGGGADEEALRVVREAKFEPGYNNGEPARVQYALPIFFKLSSGSSEENPDQVLRVVDEMPELIGGFEGLREEIKYPEEAMQAGIEGRVFMTFIVNRKGNVENAKVDHGIGYGADEEALRVIRQTKFEPGYSNGEPVRVQYSLGIMFELPQE